MFSHDFYMISTMLPFHHPSPRKSAGNKGRGELAAKAARKQASQASVGTVDEVGFVDENYPLVICYVAMEATALEIVDLSWFTC